MRVFVVVVVHLLFEATLVRVHITGTVVGDLYLQRLGPRPVDGTSSGGPLQTGLVGLVHWVTEVSSHAAVIGLGFHHYRLVGYKIIMTCMIRYEI